MSQLVALCPLDDIAPGGSRGFAERGLLAVRSADGGRVFVYRNRCPHLGIPLEWQEHRFLDASGSMIECANHSALFVIETGECVSGPCAQQRLQALTSRVENGWLMVAATEAATPSLGGGL